MTSTPSPMHEQNSQNQTGDQSAPQCTVYYDGACPLCQREINLYQSMGGADDIRWHDVSSTAPGADDLSTSQAMSRFHVRRADGTLISGARGFFEVMKTIPKLRWLGNVLSIPPIPWIAEIGYRGFLLVRPLVSKALPAAKRKPRNDAADKTP